MIEVNLNNKDKKYKVEKIWDSIVYVKKSKINIY